MSGRSSISTPITGCCCRRRAKRRDEAQSARATIAAEGLTTTNRYGNAVAHPAVAIEQRARADFARLLRQLDLDGEVDPSFARRKASR